MTPKKSDATTATLALAVYSLSQQGVYTKEMITFKGDFPCDIELPLCVYQEPNGGFGITLEDKHPPGRDPRAARPRSPAEAGNPVNDVNIGTHCTPPRSRATPTYAT